MQHSGAALSMVPQAIAQSYQETQTQLISVDGTIQRPNEMVASTPTQIQEAHSTTNHMVSQPVSAVQIHHESDGAVENDKRSIYKHPLFPLMALLFEKCEQATQTPDCPSADSFDVDIQTFVHHQEQDRKPFFSEDPDLDNLMVKAIQVLRIHLLELEKVNELCKDFCNRYITCLRGKLQSDNLLRIDGITGLDGSPTMPGSQQVVTSSSGGVVIQQNVSQPALSVATLNQGQIVSGGTVYQMVQTPQGIVAQPIQIQNSQQQQQHVQTTQAANTQVIHGSTPLSQIGVPSTPVSTHTSTITSPTVLAMTPTSPDFDDDDFLGKKKNKRGVLPKQATQVMRSWLFQHIVHPYPTEDEKRHLASQTNLSLLQVNNWFINARRRILQPMLDASNPEQAKVKKNKPQNRPVQRFWPDSLANLQPQPDNTQENTTSSQTTQNSQTSSPALTSQPQQLILPPGTMVTADGQLISTTTATTAAVNLHLNSLLGQATQQDSHNNTLILNTPNNNALNNNPTIKTELQSADMHMDNSHTYTEESSSEEC